MVVPPGVVISSRMRAGCISFFCTKVAVPRTDCSAASVANCRGKPLRQIQQRTDSSNSVQQLILRYVDAAPEQLQ